MTLKDLLNNNDRFANSVGARLTTVSEGYAKAEMTVEERHLNGGNVCQGGAFFTLADLAIAAAMNSHGLLTFGIENNISFVKSAGKGDVLTAEARETVNHHKIPYIEAKIYNQDGELCCIVSGLAYRKKDNMPFDTLE